MLGKLVPLQAAELCGLVRADVAVVRFPAVVSRLADSLVLGLFVPRQTALLRGNVTALVASILRVLLLLGLDAARLTPGVVHLVKAVPGETNINTWTAREKYKTSVTETKQNQD